VDPLWGDEGQGLRGVTISDGIREDPGREVSFFKKRRESKRERSLSDKTVESYKAH